MKKLIFILMMGVIFWNTAAISEAGTWRRDKVGWWYELEEGKKAKSQWIQDTDGSWYYFSKEGFMMADIWVGNYYLGPSGAMLTNTITPDGYKVDETGAWVPEAGNIWNGDFHIFLYPIDRSQPDPWGVDYVMLELETLYIAGHIMDGNYNDLGYIQTKFKVNSSTLYWSSGGASPDVRVSKEYCREILRKLNGLGLILKLENGTVVSATIAS
ncbi:MAG: hypothetical protein Q4A19_08800 [Johnsonella sp.]|nr:hypothetical protein [Johnsonella sp.]